MADPALLEAISELTAAIEECAVVEDELVSAARRTEAAWATTVGQSPFDGRYAIDITTRFGDARDGFGRLAGTLADRRVELEAERARLQERAVAQGQGLARE